ncbi:Hypothetical predicted protein [Podarcis lilfordi]|uniref:Uncharacterized protein n=1 Tax=Podarcis lilfordi TaxID=74358 RepID=A0AA35KP71_9SAUR|nr:Hypothetical predicted protein [Podarcis lilfordi]
MHFAKMHQGIQARGSVTGVAKGKVAFLSSGTSKDLQKIGGNIIASSPACLSEISGFALSSSAERILPVNEVFYEPYRSLLLAVEVTEASQTEVCWPWAT